MKTNLIGQYMIYKMYKQDINDMETLFFLPDESFSRYFRRITSLNVYKADGYQIAGVMYVSHEAYLNARLQSHVEDYCELDAQEQDTRRRFRIRELDEEVAVKTLELIADQKWTVMKQIAMTVRRLTSHDYDVENEIALQLYDQYLKAIL